MADADGVRAGYGVTGGPEPTDEMPTEVLPEGCHTVVLGVGDLNGILRGKRVTAEHWRSVRRRGISLDNTFFAMDVGSLLVPNDYSAADSGYPDLNILPRGPLRPIPWEDGVWMCLGRAQEKDGSPIPLDPRKPLLEAVEKARSMGLEPRAAGELEFYLLDPATGRPREERPECYGLARAAELEPILGPVRRNLAAMGVPVEQSNPEFSAGQVEVNLRHAPTLEAADHTLLLRGMIKQMVRPMGLIASFMAKPFHDRSGNGFHVHHSLWRDGRNAFAKDGGLSDEGRWFLGGLQAAMRESSLVGSAHPNAYRRRKLYSYAPISASWGVDNRTVALRVIDGEDAQDDPIVRIESREAAADCNPYLLMAVQLAAGLKGIEQEIEPTRPTEGDAYAADNRRRLPTDIHEAIDAARASAFLEEALGPMLVDLLIRNAEREIEIVEREVTRAELDRYLEVM
ncbi:glutamine synthetase family protein [Albimonas sp. CAU 1670]|uniref:glutamine synthetase family protein n=1 Tax=Albimonas sp. CAU 1670 TaxID=3032599 RepID=UPI0023DA023D|nr:glutamine synthetase family protein [Albimonas sp. CAU 1670]MDF2231144.1 glutamine synthetase family protein [Albimonas sp. CAU 1670]